MASRVPWYAAHAERVETPTRERLSGFDLRGIINRAVLAIVRELETYARSHDRLHWPAWVAFNKRTARSRGDVGIWHETYLVRAGEYEAIYSGMPRFGLGQAGKLVSAVGRKESARGRAGREMATS